MTPVALGQDRRHSIPCQFQWSWWCQCMSPSTIPTINPLLCTYTCAYWFQMVYIHVSIDFRWLWCCLLMQYPLKSMVILTIIILWSSTVYTTNIMIMYFYYHDYRLVFTFTVLSLSSCLDYSYHHAIVFMVSTMILFFFQSTIILSFMITIIMLLISYSDILWSLRWLNVASTSSFLSFQVLRELPDLRGVGPAARGAQEANEMEGIRLILWLVQWPKRLIII